MNRRTRTGAKILKGSWGNAVLSSMVMAGIVAGAATVAYRNFNGTYSSTRVGRIKAKQSIVEAQVRRRALQPEAYLDCSTAGISACRVNEAYFSDLASQNVTGARCDDKTAACGVAARNFAFSPATRLFTADVAYSGAEVNLKPMRVSLEIPLEVLQAPKFHCGEKDKTKPIFVGFRDGTGEPICEGFNACPIGQFVKGVDVSKRTLICQDLPRNIACGEQSMFTRLGWRGHSVDYDCSPLPDPPFVSNLRTRVLASVTQPVTNTETVTTTNTSTDPNPPTETKVTDSCSEAPLRWLNDSNWSSGDAFNPRAGDPPSSAVCSFCYVGAPGGASLPFNRDNGACSNEGEKCWCKNVFACQRDCNGGSATSNPPTTTPNPTATTGTWTYYGINGNTGGICPGGTMMGTMFRDNTLGPCTTIGATCSVNVMGNALAGGGGHVRNYVCQ
jgi:hypothetical protein